MPGSAVFWNQFSAAHHSIPRSHSSKALDMLGTSLAAQDVPTAKVTSINAPSHAPNAFTNTLKHSHTHCHTHDFPLSAAEHVMPLPERACCCLLVISALELGLKLELDLEVYVAGPRGVWVLAGRQRQLIDDMNPVTKIYLYTKFLRSEISAGSVVWCGWESPEK